ncbi:3159_t:CDS:2, partial [Racocetra persica]
MPKIIQPNNLVTDSVIISDSSALDNQIAINVPFPPKIDPRDLITLLPDGNVPTRTPNAFIIYRKALIEAVRAEGHNLPMSSISSIASKQWYKEPDNVKSEYKRLAIEAFNYSNTIIKSTSISRRRKNERWNTITFNNNSMTSRKDPKRPKKLSKNSKVQSPSRRGSTPENWEEYAYQSPEIGSIPSNECMLEDNLDAILSPIPPFISDSYQQMSTEVQVPHQNTWMVGNYINNGLYYYDTNLTSQLDKNVAVNDGFFGFSEFPYVDTGK